MVKMHFWGVGGEALKVIKTKTKRQDENTDIKIIFLVHKKKQPLNAACYDRCCLICLILMFFCVLFWGEPGEWGWRVWGLLPHGLGPLFIALGGPSLGSRERTPC